MSLRVEMSKKDLMNYCFAMEFQFLYKRAAKNEGELVQYLI